MQASALVRIVRHASGPRVYVAGARLHHGTAGIIAIASYPLLRNRALVIAGTIALAHDRRDFPFRDHNNH